MKTHNMLNIIKKSMTVGFLTLAFMLLGICFFETDIGKVFAASVSQEAHFEAYTDISTYRSTEGYTAPKAKDTGYEEWIFAGWYAEDKETTIGKNITTQVGTYYAKFVPAEVMSVKCQVADGTIETTPSSKLRVITTLDSLEYSEVGFDFTIEGIGTKHYSSKKVAKRIASRTDGVNYEYSPKIFDVQSEYFTTVTITGISDDYYDNAFYIEPYWITRDGTKVYGVSRYARVEDYYLNIVNVPIRVSSDTVVAAGGVVIDYDETNFKYVAVGYGTDLSPAYHNGDVFETVTTVTDSGENLTYFGETATVKAADGTLLHLRFQILNPQTAPKTNVFGITEERFVNAEVVSLNIGDVIYKNFNGGNTGVADTSWYDANEDAFVITSKDELLGFANKSKSTNFVGKTVYLAKDIELNTENAADWATDAPETIWNPVGATDESLQFAGTFDGQGHMISGLYYSKNDNNFGMFKKVAQSATITNFTLANSYISSADKSNDTHIGVIAGSGAGTYSDIHINEDVILQSSGGGVGGVIGCVNLGGKTIIQNCWFEGKMIMGATAYRCGGFVGYATYKTTTKSAEIQFIDCLNTGTMQCDSTSLTGRIGGFIGAIEGETDSTTSPKVELTRCLAGTTFTTTLSKISETDVGTVAGALRYASSGATLTVDANSGVYVVKSDKVADKLGNASALSSNATVVENLTNIVVINAEDNIHGFGAYSDAANLDYYDDYTGKTDTGAWVARVGDTPALRSFVSTGIFCVPDTSWYDEPVRTEADGTKVYVIDSVADFYGFTALAKTEDFAGEKIELEADINLNKGEATEWANRAPQNQWVPVGYHNAGSGNAGTEFAGTFDGKGHCISGVYVQATANIGMFGKLSADSKLMNFRLVNSYISSVNTNTRTTFIGTLAGSGCGDFESIYTDAIVQGYGAGIGGFIGTINNAGTANMSNCWFDGTVNVFGKAGNAGGFVGDINGASYALQVDNCLSTGTINFNSTDTIYRIADIIGSVRQGAQVTMEDCLSAGTIVNGPSSKCGSVIGSLEDISTSHVNIASGSNVYTTITSPSKTIGNEQAVTGTGAIVKVNKANTYGFNGLANLADLSFYGDVTTNGKWMASVDQMPILKTFAEGTGYIYNADTTWYDAPVRTETDGTKVYVIDSIEDFYGFASLSRTENFAGEKIELATDIIINEGKASEWATTAPEFTWLPIGFYNGVGTQFAGTFDGKTHTISGVYVAAQNNLGFFGKLAATAALKNFSLVNSFIHSTSDRNGVAVNVGAIAGSGCGTFDSIYTDAIVQSHGGGIAGFLGIFNNAGTTTITNCWFDGTINMLGKSYHGAGFVGDINGSSYKLEMNNCLFTGTINFKSTDANYRVGGLIGGVREGAQVTLSDCVSAGEINSTNESKTGTVVGSLENVSTSKVTITAGNTVYSTSECYSKAIGNDQAVTGDGAIAHKAKSNFYSTKASDLDFDIYWKPLANSTPILKCFETDKRWYNVTDAEFLIETEAQFWGFAELSLENNFAGQTVKLGADMIVNEGNAADWATEAPEKVWKPIAWAAGSGTPFAGTFDGQGHTISGIYVYSNNNLGLFGKVAASATLKDFRLVNSYITTEAGKTGNAFVGSIAGSGGGTFDKIYSNAIVNSSGIGVGGFIGCMNLAGTDSTISNCWFDGRVQVVGAAYYEGGFVGSAGWSNSNGSNPVTIEATVSDSLFSGSVDYNSQGEYSRVGGFIGGVIGGSSVEFIDLMSVGTITTTSDSTQQACFVGIIGSTSSVTIPEGGDVYGGYDCFKRQFGFTNDRLYGEEYVHEVQSKKELYGHGAYLAATNFDFDNAYANAAGNGKWVLREGTYPIPKCFETAEDVRVDLSCFILEGETTPAVMTDYGDGNYIAIVENTEKSYYDAHIQKLVDFGFVKHSDNGVGLDNGAVYSSVYQKDSLTMTLTYVTAEKKIYISAGQNQAVSAHLIENSNDATNGAMSLAMMALEERSGNNFIIQLENGHFIIYDFAQTQVDYENALAYMKSLTGGEKPVVDALIISHAHVDHYGILDHIDEDDNGVEEEIYVQGVYYSMPSKATYSVATNGYGNYTAIAKRIRKLRMEDGTTTPRVYRLQTGQKYYFDGVVMDVMFTQEQISGYTDFNETSTWCMFTIGNERVLMGADAGQVSMNAVMNMYSANYLYSDVFAGFHHGINTWNEFTDYCATNTIVIGKAVDDVVLYSRKGDPTDSNSYTTEDLGDLINAYIVSSDNNTLIQKVNKGVDGHTHFYYGQGTIKLNFTESGITSEILNNTTE